MKATRSLAYSLLATSAILGGSLALSWQHWSPATAEAQTAKPTAQPEAQATLPAAELSRSFRSVHQAMANAVVNIQTVREVKAPAGGNRRMQQLPEPFRRMLPPGMVPPGGGEEDDDIPMMPPHGRMEGTGSGVIVSPDGYILTNNHVIEDADKITVRLEDGREIDAKTIGRDPKTDIAVIKIEEKGLTYAKFGNSDDVQVGDWVLAFGSPFGYEQTMTAGIISAKHRNIPIIAEHNPALAGMTYEDFLQTDAAINPGNSGGPLVSLAGEVIGINTAIASRSGAYNGIGFAIPASEAKYIMDSLIKNGKVVRGYLGIGIRDVKNLDARKIARSFGFQGDTGVLVDELRADSPAGKGGVKKGDIITTVNGKKIATINELRSMIARTAPGGKVELGLFRDGKTLQLSFPVGTQPDTLAAARGNAKGGGETPGAVQSDDAGLTVATLDEATAKKLGLSESTGGVVITKVAPDSVAAQSGLMPGCVILNVFNQEIRNLDDYKAAMSKRKLSEGVRLSVRDPNGTERYVFLQSK